MSKMPGNTPKKSLGQHWLFDEASLNAMLAAGEVSSDDTVLEVGPGLGTLTKKLCEKARKVIAVELDDTLAAELTQNIGGPSFLSFDSEACAASPLRLEERRQESSTHDIAEGDTKSDWIPDQAGDDTIRNLEIINQNILEFDTLPLPKNYKVIANIPYYLTSNLIRVMLESSNPPSIMALLIQKEVAERIAAQPGGMSILAVATQFYAEVALKELVPAELFTPPPKVDSQIIQIKRRSQPLFPDVDTQKFFQLVRAGFSEKRKKLRSSLSGGLQISKEEADALLAKAKLPSNARAQELMLDQWHDLYQAY